MENMEKNCEKKWKISKIGKIQKKIWKKYGKYGRKVS
jgi:hypothetical protein